MEGTITGPAPLTMVRVKDIDSIAARKNGRPIRRDRALAGRSCRHRPTTGVPRFVGGICPPDAGRGKIRRVPRPGARARVGARNAERRRSGHARNGRRGSRAARARDRAGRRRAEDAADSARPARRQEHLSRSARRHRRRRGRDLRRRPVPHVRALRRDPRLHGGDACRRVPANTAAIARSSAASPATARSRASSSSPACIACSACRPPRRRDAFTPRPCTVAILPEPDEVEATDLNPAELRVDTYPRVGRRRPARQQDRLGHSHHAPAHAASWSSARTNARSTRTARAPWR